MIAVSSHRPGCELHHAAHRTWANAFDYSVYFGDPDIGLDNARTAFVASEPFPTIRTLAEFCAQQPGWSAIINADIFLGTNFRHMTEHYISQGYISAISARHQFTYHPGQAPENYRIEDYGMDIFAAEQNVWRMVCVEIPSFFRIGRILWDTWMIGFFIVHCGAKLADLSPWQAVFHPRHEVSPQRNAVPLKYSDKYTAKARWPLARNEQSRIAVSV